jgi:hypothetical protein
MAISDAQYTAWLSSPSANRCVLVEAVCNSGGSEVTRYMSNRGYVTKSTDSPANTVYKALLSNEIKLTESLALESVPSLSYGDIEIENAKGSLDSWLEDVWDNRTVSIFYGDMRWDRADFRLVVKGTLDGIKTSRRERLNLSLRDSLQRLNTPITETKLGGTTTNKDKLIPLTFGECHNVSPLLVDPVAHVYQVHNGAIEDIIEVRDNGSPITVTKDLANGKFTLAYAPVGTITCSVQGSKPSTYSNQIADIVKLLVKNYGTASNRLTDSDIDLSNFSAFAAANTAPVGLYISERMNLIEACQQLSGSVGAQVKMSRTGLLQFVRIDFPASGTPFAITKKHLTEDSLSVDSLVDITAATNIGYCKNYTVEPNLQTVIPEEHKSLYAREWLTTIVSDSVVATKYKLLTEPVMKETLLQTGVAATAEATRRNNITKVQKTVLKMSCFASCLELVLGQAVTITHDRFGLNAGKTGVVVGLEPNYTKEKINVKVMV